MHSLSEWGNVFFLAMNLVVIVFILFVFAFYLALFLISAKKLNKERGLDSILYYQSLETSAHTLPLSIIVPAYNEEAGIVGSVRSLVGGMQYPLYEVIVVNDGSKDQTLNKMIEEFSMAEMNRKVIHRKGSLGSKTVKAVYQSAIYPNLFLIDKDNGGKADALNAGINLSKYPYFVSLDGDTVLDYSAFIRIIKPILEASPGEEIIASGGTVAIANDCHIERGELKAEDIVLSRKPVVIMQVIEYMRAFLLGRIGLSQYNLLLIISGAFGVFKTDWVVRAGGYKVDTVGEDMELVVRLHRMIREEKSKARIVYTPDPVCYTEAPEELKILHRQRTRWHRGTFESLWAHRKMMLNPRYGGIGMISMPYFLFVELLGPVIELLGYLAVIIGFILGGVYIKFALLLFILTFLYGSFLSIGAVLLEEWLIKRYPKPRDLTRLMLYALSESFWYRPIMTIWRFQGLIQAIRGKKHGWGEMTRKGVSS